MPAEDSSYSSGLENTGLYGASQEEALRLVTQLAERNERRGLQTGNAADGSFQVAYRGDRADEETETLGYNANESLRDFQETALDVTDAWNAQDRDAFDVARRAHNHAAVQWFTDGRDFHQAVAQVFDTRDQEIRETLADPNNAARQWATEERAAIPDPAEREAVYPQDAVQQPASPQGMDSFLAEYSRNLINLAEANERRLEQVLAAQNAEAPPPFAEARPASPMQVDENPMAAYMRSNERRIAEIEAERSPLPSAPSGVAQTLASQRAATPSPPPREREQRNGRDGGHRERERRHSRDRGNNNGSSQNGSRRSGSR